jgi:NAD(P)-dependent dehydrogenase (short-subunit alcohol dehydrogenase family)
VKKLAAVITGGTKGIGYGCAKEFLKRGCNVVICGRNGTTIDQACNSLSSYAQEGCRILGTVCNVTNYDDVQSLWEFAASQYGCIDLWINNAGIGQPQTMLWDLTPTLISSLADINYKGVLFGCSVAASRMLQQPEGGAIYNMEGLGSDGMTIKGMTLYASSKRALSYITISLSRELHGTKVIVCSLQPGMVATDLITRQYIDKPEEWKKVQKIFNILADRVETVTPWLVDRIISNKKNGARIRWFTKRKAFVRFLFSPFNKRHVFDHHV